MGIKGGLFEHCQVNTNEDDNRFVGVKSDSDNIMVYFPIGYQLPQNEKDLRKDIIHLIATLSEFSNFTNEISSNSIIENKEAVRFPVNAYLEIINMYLDNHTYYTENESLYKTHGYGKINWSRTIKKNKPLVQSNGSVIYTNFVVKHSKINEENLITKIHKYCVYESFSKLGWLFTNELPEKPFIEKDRKLFLYILRNKLNTTNNDREKRLFLSMISIIEYIDDVSNSSNFFYGTNRFEYVWEKLIDRVFGVNNKKMYFPTTNWNLKSGKKRTNAALEPDTIMIYDSEIYVLDAKYYKFGITGNPKHLPESSSINKQITYAEYIHTENRFKEIHGSDISIYNAFIMPYNLNDNPFGCSKLFENIGEATGNWKNEGHNYERVQGIVVDVRYLMHHYLGDNSKQINNLATMIKSGLK